MKKAQPRTKTTTQKAPAVALPAPYYTIKITRTQKELGEVGHQFVNTHRKDEKGEDIWDYTPHEIGVVTVTRDVLAKTVERELDLAAIERAINRAPKEVMPK